MFLLISLPIIDEIQGMDANDSILIESHKEKTVGGLCFEKNVL